MATAEDNYEDWAYEQARQRRLDAEWEKEHDNNADDELSRAQDQQLKELETT